MKNRVRSLFIALVLLAFSSPQFSTASAQSTTAFTYQGRLNVNGQPANGSYNLVFALFDAGGGGNQFGITQTNSATAVSNGLFTVVLDYGNVFDGSARWLELGVQTNTEPVAILSPRQRITPAPYAIMAGSASNLLGSLPTAQLSGSFPAAQISGTVPLAQLPGSVVTNMEAGVTLGGAFSGNGSGLTNLNYGSIVNPPVIPSTNGFVTASITNGLAATGFVTSQGYLTSANGGKAALATNVVSGISITNAFITNSIFSGDGGSLSNLNYANIANPPTLPTYAAGSGLNLSGSTFSIPNGGVANSMLANNTVTVTAGSGLAGGGNVALGGSVSLNNSGVLSVTATAPLSSSGGQAPAIALTGIVPLTQLPPVLVTNNEAGVVLSGSFAGDGSGLVNVSGTFAWQVVAGTNVQSVSNTGYLLTNSAQVTVTLPASPNVGDIVRLSDSGSGGWKLVENTGQSVANFAPNLGWVQRTTAGQNWHAIASSADGTKLVAAGVNNQIYTSGDSGVTWISQPGSPAVFWDGATISSDGTKLAAVETSGDIFTSSNSGATWTDQTNGAPHGANWNSIASSADGTKLIAAGNGIYISSDSGATWTNQTALPGNSCTAASSADGTKLVALDGGVWTSSNSGVTWAQQASAPPINGKPITSSADGTKLAALSSSSGIYTSSDSGASWIDRTNNIPLSGWTGIASSTDGTKLIAAGSFGGTNIYISGDSGATWIGQTNIPNNSFVCVASSADGTKLLAAGNYIYTSGVLGYLTGGQNTALELQYIGNGQFLPISYTGSISAY